MSRIEEWRTDIEFLDDPIICLDSKSENIIRYSFSNQKSCMGDYLYTDRVKMVNHISLESQSHFLDCLYDKGLDSVVNAKPDWGGFTIFEQYSYGDPYDCTRFSLPSFIRNIRYNGCIAKGFTLSYLAREIYCTGTEGLII